jgi:hypothetical protein
MISRSDVAPLIEAVVVLALPILSGRSGDSKAKGAQKLW